MAVDSSWATVGARVAVVTRGGPYDGAVKLTTVERLTATQIVCASGEKFRRDTLRRVGEQRGGYGPRCTLQPVDSPNVRDARARGQLRSLMERAQKAAAQTKPGYRRTHAEVAAILAEIGTLVHEAQIKVARIAKEGE